MTNHVLLNNVDHKDLRIVTRRSASLGDDLMYAITFFAEFRNLQAHYPVVFRKESVTGRFQSVAMFGFEDRENLFLDEDGWHATYVPLSVERQPFLIGFQEVRDDGTAERRPVIHVDMDSPRVGYSEGEPVFREHGGITDYLDRMNSVLRAIHEGLEANEAFIAALVEHELLESFTLDVELDDGSEHRLAGFYTIDEDALNALGGQALASLQQRGYLQAIYMAIASLSNIRTLIERRNARLAPAAAAAGTAAREAGC